MAETKINVGWLKDTDGTQFAPMTLLSQIQTDNGTLLSSYLNSTYAKASHSHGYLPTSGGTLSGALTINGAITATGWINHNGDGGFYWNKYGGGLYMSDETWIRSYNDKNIYTGGAMQANGGFKTSSGSTFSGGCIELYGNTPYIDFHFDGSSSDYTTRIIESSSGTLTVTGQLRAESGLLISNSNGIYWETYGGGWYMEDSSWMMVRNNKNVYTAGSMRANEGFTVDNRSTGWINALTGTAGINVINSGNANGFNCLGRIKSANGAWILGTLNSTNAFYVAYGNQTRLNNGSNGTDRDFIFYTDGTFYAGNINAPGSSSTVGKCTFGSESAQIIFSNSNRAFFKVGNSTCSASFVAASDGYVGLNDSVNSKWMICTYKDGTIYLGHDYKLVVPTASSVGIRPGSSNSCSCGHSSYLWTAVYAKTSSIQTSDVREKDILDQNLEDFSDMFMKMKPVAFKWKSGFGSDVVSFGIAAQDTVKCFEDAGYDYQEYNMIHHDELETPSEFGHTERYSASYNDVHMLTMMQTQKNTRELENLRAENAELRERLEKLEKLLG